jgi:hypothetical protein
LLAGRVDRSVLYHHRIGVVDAWGTKIVWPLSGFDVIPGSGDQALPLDPSTPGKGQPMAITEKKNAFVNQDAAAYSMSQIFAVPAASSNPTYMVLTVLDRDEYTAGASGATGSLSGNGHTLGLSNIGGDGRGTGITFTYRASSGRYYSSTYGYLDQITYNASSSAGDVTNLSLFSTNSLSLANAYATNL